MYVETRGGIRHGFHEKPSRKMVRVKKVYECYGCLETIRIDELAQLKEIGNRRYYLCERCSRSAPTWMKEGKINGLRNA